MSEDEWIRHKLAKEDLIITEDVCQKCLKKLQENMTDNPPACVVYQDEPHHWLRLLKDCTKLKTCLQQVIAESETIKSMWG